MSRVAHGLAKAKREIKRLVSDYGHPVILSPSSQMHLSPDPLPSPSLTLLSFTLYRLQNEAREQVHR